MTTDKKRRVAELEGRTAADLPYKRIVRYPHQDITALQEEVLEDGERVEDFNWIVRTIVEPGEVARER